MGAEAIECLKFMGWEWTVDQGWNEKKEEVSKSTNIEKNEIFEDLRREEIAQLEAENHRLRDEFQKTLKISARLEEVGRLREENKKLKEQIEQDATPHIIETVRQWFMKSNSNPLDFVRWTNADPIIMITNVLKEYDEYYQKQKDYDEIIGELGIMIENIDQNACDVFNKLTEKYRDEFDELTSD